MCPWPIALAAACLLLPSLTAANTLADDMDASTVRLICFPKEGNPGAGSGFVVGRGDFVVTNHHVIACTKAGGRRSCSTRRRATWCPRGTGCVPRPVGFVSRTLVANRKAGNTSVPAMER